MGISILSIRITGISALLMNNPANMGAGRGGGLNTKQIPSAADEAAGKTYADEKGNLYLPSIMFRSALLGACAGRRMGKVGARTVLAGAIFTVTDRVPLVHPTTGKPITTYRVNSMRAVVNKAGVTRSRPEIAEWAANLDFEVDDEFIKDPAAVLELMNIAGRVRGVGDFRPQKGGPFGRFRAEAASNTVQKRKVA